MYLPELSTAAMWMGSKTVSCTALLKLHVDWLCVVSVMQYSNLWESQSEKAVPFQSLSLVLLQVMQVFRHSFSHLDSLNYACA